MTTDNTSLDNFVCAAIEIASTEDRAAYIAQACGDDYDLQGRVEKLVAAHFRAGSFLEEPAVPGLAEELADQGTTRETQDELPAQKRGSEGLDFLAPAGKPGSLGRLGHYEIQEVLGHGGMGIVLKAFDEQLQRVVAIKVMAAHLATNATARKRFAREARAAAAVSHDHIVTIHAVEEANGLPYLVMQYVNGLSLQERLDRDGPLEVEEIVRIGMQTAAGLAAAHAQGLIHRDIKPANILLENGVERVKITDFGLARAAADAHFTQTGVVAGTPQYMAPEQGRGEALDGRTDLFSLGSVLYALCTGRSPFAASQGIVALARVCQATPRPIRERRSEVPDWLVAFIDKLLAKDPADRYQSAAEVAEILTGHLAHLQHPSVMPLPAALMPKVPPPIPRRRNRAIAAAAVLLCLLGGLGLTEATGVTRLATTVIRILTPDGTLVVEVDDPGVKVTIEGDGGIVITGAGPQEVRLRPGSYKVRAIKDGKPVREEELVTITRGGKQVVKVRVEGEAPSATAAPKAESEMFVVLGGKGVEVRKHDTLAEAVQGASDGDTIEVRGNGPFVTEPIHLGKTALTIRAGEGFRPVIKLSPEGLRAGAPLLGTEAALVLEGLELQRMAQDAKEVPPWKSVLTTSKELHVSNCRFLMSKTHICIYNSSPVSELRNCEFLCADNHGALVNLDLHQSGQRLVIDNCLLTAFARVNTQGQHKDKGVFVQLTRNTFRTRLGAFWFYQVFDKAPSPKDLDQRAKLMSIETSGNIFDAGFVFQFEQQPPGKRFPTRETESYLAQTIGWVGERNLYAVDGPFAKLGTLIEPTAPVQEFPQTEAVAVRNLVDWRRFWATAEGNSIEGRAKYQGGDLLAKLVAAPEQLTPEDFRLRPDSAGYRAGKDGKDLGADVDLVGPGPAYERWKKTPEYQKWLKDTKQVTKAETPKAESKAFVVLGGKGVAVRKYDTLAEAVQGASAGDTIEVRGNGPFACGSIKITQALTIRAGEGFRPVIQLSSNITTNSPLVLEGLELQRLGEKVPVGGWVESLVFSDRGKSLYLANCRFREHLPLPCVVTDAQSYFVRNCEFLCPHEHAINWGGFLPGKHCVIDNCVAMGVGYGILHLQGIVPDQHDTAVRLTHNTVMSENAMRYYLEFEKHRELTRADHVIPVEAAGNIFDVTSVLFLVSRGNALQPKEVEPLLRLTRAWRGGQNVYAPGASSFDVRAPVELPNGPKNLKDWKQFWGIDEAGSIEGQVKYQGGNLISKLRDAPEKVTAVDFRLRPDSAGYKAGKDGKDLGADVDLVGPGPAYERWKKTPEYQQWQKDSGQVKK